jgi:hypothetical protein
VAWGWVIATKAEAQAEITDKEAHAICAAANVLLATAAEPGMFEDLFMREAQRHATAARKLGATDADLEQAALGLRAAYEGGHTTWAAIADTGKDCTNL